MSIYIRKYISTCEGFGWQVAPTYNTRIVPMRNKSERRNAEWDQPRHQFTVPFNNILQPAWVPIKRMHMNRRGAWGAFLYSDPLDHTAVDEVFAIAVAGEDTFQLAKRSEIEGVDYFREVDAIYEPGDDGDAEIPTLVVYVDGTPTTAYTLNHDTGQIVFDTPMTGGEVLSWTGPFSVWVRFENDALPFSIDNKSGGHFVVNGTVSLIQVRAPADGEIDS